MTYTLVQERRLTSQNTQSTPPHPSALRRMPQLHTRVGFGPECGEERVREDEGECLGVRLRLLRAFGSGGVTQRSDDESPRGPPERGLCAAKGEGVCVCVGLVFWVVRFEEYWRRCDLGTQVRGVCIILLIPIGNVLRYLIVE